MRHFFELVLDVHLQLENLFRVVWVIDLLGNLRGFLVHAGFEQALGMVKLVLDHVRVELGELVVHFGRVAVVLNVEVAIGEEGESCAVSWGELKLIVEDSDDLEMAHTLLVQIDNSWGRGLTSLYFWSRMSW